MKTVNCPQGHECTARGLFSTLFMKDDSLYKSRRMDGASFYCKTCEQEYLYAIRGDFAEGWYVNKASPPPALNESPQRGDGAAE